jgi:hypothetical protein
MSALRVCSTVLRPYPRGRGNAQTLRAEVEIDRIFEYIFRIPADLGCTPSTWRRQGLVEVAMHRMA